MGTVQEICWSTKFRKQHKLGKVGKLQSANSSEVQGPCQTPDEVTDTPSKQKPAEQDAKKQDRSPFSFGRKRSWAKDKVTKPDFPIPAEEAVEDSPKHEEESFRLKEFDQKSVRSQISICLKATTSRDPETVYCEPVPVLPEPNTSSHCKMCNKKKARNKPHVCCAEKPEKTPEKCPNERENICKCQTKPVQRPKRKKVKVKRSKANSSSSAISQNVRANCCTCCGLLAEYFREIVRLLCCNNDTRLSEVFSEMCEVASCLCYDCFNLLRKFLSCVMK